MDIVEAAEGSAPDVQGMYVCWLAPLTEGFPFTERELLMFVGGRWGYCGSDQFCRRRIYAWLGPIPSRRVAAFSL